MITLCVRFNNAGLKLKQSLVTRVYQFETRTGFHRHFKTTSMYILTLRIRPIFTHRQVINISSLYRVHRHIRVTEHGLKQPNRMQSH